MHHFLLKANKGGSHMEFGTLGCQGNSDFQTGTFDFGWCSRSWTQKIWPPRYNGAHHYICWQERQKVWGCTICGDYLWNVAPALGLRQQCCPCQQHKGHDREEMLVRSMPGAAASMDLDIPWTHLKCTLEQQRSRRHLPNAVTQMMFSTLFTLSSHVADGLQTLPSV